MLKARSHAHTHPDRGQEPAACAPRACSTLKMPPGPPGRLERPGSLPVLLAATTVLAALAVAQAARLDPTSSLQGGRRQLQAAPGSRGAGRALAENQTACQCPPPADAQAACAAGAQPDKDTLLRTAIQHCQRQGYAPALCCPAMPINDTARWTLWRDCLWCARFFPRSKRNALAGAAACFDAPCATGLLSTPTRAARGTTPASPPSSMALESCRTAAAARCQPPPPARHH